MFYIQDDWFLIVFAYNTRSEKGTRYLVSGFQEMKFDTDQARDPEYLLRNGINVVSIENKKFIDALINSGLTTTCPLRINEDLTLTPLFKKDNVTEKKLVNLLPRDAEVISEDGQFDSPYAMCPRCGHPVTVKVKTKINQATLDKINNNEETIIESGSIEYQCRNCGYCEEGKVYNNLKVRKTSSNQFPINFIKEQRDDLQF